MASRCGVIVVARGEVAGDGANGAIGGDGIVGRKRDKGR